MMLRWLRGLLRRRPARLLATACGVAVAVALLASLGSFLSSAQATMTDRAVRGVSVDWQVQVTPGADPAAITQLVDTSPGVRAGVQVGYAQTTGLTTTTGASTQKTGPGVVLGLPTDYRSLFPGEIRSLIGADTGVLLAQQTAANLHATQGDTIAIGRVGLPPATVTIAGVVDLPQANSLFQKIGSPATAQPVAPPDNVLLLPQTQWHQVFDPLAEARPDQVATQVHVLREHELPADPASAYTTVTGAAHNLQARSVGGAVVGDNLGTVLDAARADAAYARVLFLFLGVPGAVLAAMVTATVAAAGAGRRRAEQALLRARGASARQLLRLAAAEAIFIGVVGSVVGLFGATLAGYLAFGVTRFGATSTTALISSLGPAVVGVSIAAATVLLPARRDLRATTVASGRAVIGRLRYPTWARYGFDAALLIAAGLVFTATSGQGYQLVVAPEGVSTISVSYWAFVGPALLWSGAALLIWRLGDLFLGPGRRILARLLRPIAGRLDETVANAMSRRRRPLVRAIVLLALAIAFAVSTSSFNATYRQQAEVDAHLTNGADVTVTVVPDSNAVPVDAAQLAGVVGVRTVEPIQHRFAYVGTDLQDLYGVNPATITRATALQDSYFPGSTAVDAMATLAAKPDSVLVSTETVKDYQLNLGDPLTLRLTDAITHQPKNVAFRYVGVVSEFPTAPKDSFFVANSTFIAAQTGTDAVGAFLLDTGGRDVGAVAARTRALVGTGATVTDIGTMRNTVGSSLTSVDLAGLTRVELVFALVLAVSAGGLVFALGLAERRRTFAILTALGGSGRHLRAFILGEAVILTCLGLLAGAVTGAALSVMLIEVLTGVFDPPPASITVPWIYVTGVGGLSIFALAVVSAATIRGARRPAITVLREL
ncbi:ABC transporter permease [Rhodococcus sp. 1168]|uniref:ABC transporter permease n=1 Tax=Rhodococcus sp. 1168 TaxID=2018041 RepID=UPI000A0AF951|nr:ABC transporter permease [Rhodococcus sp. 1168]ORI13505.1 ABC transporter permease [Rhodococcus sp. 1168]